MKRRTPLPADQDVPHPYGYEHQDDRNGRYDTDRPASSQTSGLVQALRILKGVKGISFVELNKKDIVRHQLVTRIVDAYEKFDKETKAEREKRKLTTG